MPIFVHFSRITHVTKSINRCPLTIKLYKYSYSISWISFVFEVGVNLWQTVLNMKSMSPLLNIAARSINKQRQTFPFISYLMCTTEYVYFIFCACPKSKALLLFHQLCFITTSKAIGNELSSVPLSVLFAYMDHKAVSLMYSVECCMLLNVEC